MSHEVKTREVKFTGGPLDGLRESVSPTAAVLAEVIAVPVNTNLLSAIDGRPRGPKAPASSVAIYELGFVDGAVRYYFLGASTSAQFCMEQWRG